MLEPGPRRPAPGRSTAHPRDRGFGLDVGDPVGSVTSVTLNICKDNVQFGIRAVDQNGNRSPVAFPQAVA
jgi:hypothetical protein